jgi:glycine hydroxymethyltransferase
MIHVTVDLKKKAGPKLKDFKEYVNKTKVPELEALREEVEVFATQFPTIGFEKAQMRYKA